MQGNVSDHSVMDETGVSGSASGQAGGFFQDGEGETNDLLRNGVQTRVDKQDH